jgi:hypothetical protein
MARGRPVRVLVCRRGFDDVVSVELRAIAGATFAFVDPQLPVPYLGVPFDGYHHPAH